MMRLGFLSLCLFLLAAVINRVSSFAPTIPSGIMTMQQKTTTTTKRFMFEPKPLADAEDGKDAAAAAAAAPLESSSVVVNGDEEAEPVKAVYKNLARGGQYEEVKWVDPAMSANTNPLEMSWWAYILFGLPVVLLLDDAFHFLPTEGPLAFLKSI